ncbi:coiled-coil domain-containing protein [Desulfobacca acetoxidans]|uniref:DUF1640 domain-containing protein n=1 Tax=Desulfobacca acetoxidans (strain ATCC 700848 / DSM 11109 / ASRB2) TaxID=880072 RepID=F2NJH8_DESAR|nr:coiled-coil domain-containing protein [Desulfobacca acetoxidans]AEB09490.1 hypothetical protein Desac_1642 [Desulfobacca acetoxidans DSM 11109]
MLSYQRVKNIEDALGPQQAEPIIAALQELDRKIDDQRNALKADLLMELATKADVADLRAEVKADIANLRAEVKEDFANLRAEVKEDIANLRTEIANLRTEVKGEISNLRTEVKDDLGNLRTEIKTDITRLDGELKSIRLWMKLLVAIGILGISFFSPAAVKLLEMLK